MSMYQSLFVAFPPQSWSLTRLWLQRGILLGQFQRFSEGALQLRIGVAIVILRRNINFYVWISPVVLDVPADIFEPERVFGLCGDGAVDEVVAGTDADDATPGALPN